MHDISVLSALESSAMDTYLMDRVFMEQRSDEKIGQVPSLSVTVRLPTPPHAAPPADGCFRLEPH